MSDLQNQTPADTYKGLLQVGDYTNGVDGNAKNIQDGEGTNSALTISTTKVGVGTVSPSAELDVVGSIKGGFLEVATDSGLSASFSKTNHAPAIKFKGITSSAGLNYSLGITHVDASNNKFFINRTDDSDLTQQNLLTIQSDGNVGIGTTSPDAPLEVSSTTGGVIMPRMNEDQRDAISSPTDGEMIYNTSTNKFQGRANGAWVDFH